MKIIATSVHPNEPCYGIYEGPRLTHMPDKSTEWRWVQRVYVVRGDAIAEYSRDFGPAKDFESVTPLLMPSFGDDSVAQLQYWAEKNRQDDYGQKLLERYQAESTLIRDVLRQEEEILAIKANRSILGPNLNRQRNSFPSQTASRYLKERRDARRGYKRF